MKLISRALIGLCAALLLTPALADIAVLQGGATSQQLQVRAVVQATGAPDTALAYNTSGLSCSYQRPGGSVTSITLATQTVTGAYSSGGFVHLANGWYRLDVPDAAIAASVPSVLVTCAATGDTFVDGRVTLTAVNLQDSVRGGMTALPNAAAEAAGGLYTRGTGAGQINQASNGTINANTTLIGGQAASASGTVTFPAATLASTTNITAGTIATVTNLTNLPTIPSNWITAAGIASDAITAAKIADGAIDNATFLCTSSFPILGIVDCGTGQAAAGTTFQLRSAAALADDTANGMTLLAQGSTQGYYQARAATDYVGSTDTATVDTWTVTPSGTLTYYLFGTAPSTGGGSGLDAAGVRAAIGLASANLDTQLSTIDDFLDTEVAAIKTKTDFLPSATAGAAGGLFIAGSNAATTVNFTGNLSGSVGSVTGAVGSVTGAVGSVTGNVGGTVNGLTSTAQGNVRTAVGLASANLDTQLAAVSAPSAATVAAAVWDLSTTGHTTGGTFGNAMQAAGSAGDPWATSLPGAYGAGSAGYILGTNLNATMSSRMATFTLPTNFSSLSIDGSGRTLLQPTQTGVTIPTVTTLTNAPSDSSGTTTLLGRLTSTRAGYLDNLAQGLLPTAADIWNSIIEPNGSVTAKCALATDLAYAAGDLTTTTGTSTYKDPSGTATRITGTVSSPGNRLASVSCPP